MSLETEVERREELRETLHGIQALPERQRAALVAIAVADRPHADVAAELGMSDGALRQLLLRARTTLRAAATALTPYPLVTWLAGGQEVTAARVAEVAVGAGGAGVAIKAGAAMLAAGAVVVGGPALRDEHAPARAKTGAESREAQRQAAPPGPSRPSRPQDQRPAPPMPWAIRAPPARRRRARQRRAQALGRALGATAGGTRPRAARARAVPAPAGRARAAPASRRTRAGRAPAGRAPAAPASRVRASRAPAAPASRRARADRGRATRPARAPARGLGPQAVREGRAGGSAGARGTDRDRAGPGGHDRAPAVELGRGLGVRSGSGSSGSGSSGSGSGSSGSGSSGSGSG